MKAAKIKKYKFKGKVWMHKGPAGWHFVTLPKMLAKKIRINHGLDEEGWGRLKTKAVIGKSKWQTAIWFDSKFQSYLLPVKSEIRSREQIDSGDKVSVKLSLEENKVTLIKKRPTMF